MCEEVVTTAAARVPGDFILPVPALVPARHAPFCDLNRPAPHESKATVRAEVMGDHNRCMGHLKPYLQARRNTHSRTPGLTCTHHHPETHIP